MTPTAFLYLSGRLGLGKTEAAAIPVLATVFWPGGQLLTRASFTAEWMHRQGVGAARIWTARALRGLVRRGVLLEIETPRTFTHRHEFDLQTDAGRWDWAHPLVYLRVCEELRALESPQVAWEGRAELARGLATLLERLHVQGTPHPHDPHFARWMDGLGELVTRFGEPMTLAALSEACADPAAVLPPTPMGFALAFYALVQRARRHDGAHSER